MKTIKYILGSLALIAGLGICSCTGDLDVDPIDPNMNTADKALATADDFTNFLAGIYTGYATSGYYGPNGDPSISGLDGGASQYVRGLYHMQELPTDESSCCWNDQTIKNFHAFNWTTSDVFIYAFYSRLCYQIAMCNEFIRQANSTSVSLSDKDQMIAEARTLRALSYYHGIDIFGNMPFADETSSVGGSKPEQITRADLYAWLETELTDLIDNSSLPEARAAEYGRVDKGVAQMILAKLYLNAEIYTGTAAWDKCAAVLETIMGEGYSLHDSYPELFLADNNKCTDEIMFAIEQDGINTQSYGVTNYIIFASTGGEMDPAEVGISSGWGGLRATSSFVNKFTDSDTRRMFFEGGTNGGAITDISDFTAGGYPCMKFKNINSDGTAGQAAGFVDTDFPVFRYADVLLMYAECALNGAATTSEGLAALNQVRERAGLEDVTELNANTIIDERGRELYQECWRRSDLIRFGMFTTDTYLWDFKGGVADGKAVDSHYNLYPIPSQDMISNDNLVQNPGY
jgi:hypothetical protein